MRAMLSFIYVAADSSEFASIYVGSLYYTLEVRGLQKTLKIISL